jgi:hypothetical protein
MMTVRDLFIKALSMKVQHVARGEIRVQLVTLGRETGNRVIREEEDEAGYKLTFASGEKIRFDGTDYHYERA